VQRINKKRVRMHDSKESMQSNGSCEVLRYGNSRDVQRILGGSEKGSRSYVFSVQHRHDNTSE